MSSLETYRAPAWPGLEPQTRVYTEVDPRLSAKIVGTLGQSGTVRQLANADTRSSTFFRFDTEAGESWFLKVVRANRASELASAERVASWLQAHEVRVVTAKFHGQLESGRYLWAYPYHTGRPPEPSSSDMAVIGEELGKLHQALAIHPSVPEWKRQSDARVSRLTSVREALAMGTRVAGPEPVLLREIARERTIKFDPEHYAAAGPRLPLHGDMNRFNMLIDEHGCTFLDFEDVCHSFFPAIFDLATVFERVVLVDQTGTGANAAAVAMFDAYEAMTGSRVDPKWVPDVLRGLALRALCTLAEIDPAGRDEQEWRKFFGLLENAKAWPGNSCRQGLGG